MVLYSILGMVAGANSYRQMHEFIRVHLQRLNGAFGLRLPYSPSYTGLRLIIQGVNPAALEAAFRQHASSISAPTPSDSLPAIAVDGKTLRGSFDAFSDRKAAHMMSALRQADQIVLGHLMVAEKSNEIPAAPELIEALGLKGSCVHARRRTRPKKSFERVIASGNHLLTQVKDNQPSLRRRLELGVAGRKPSGSAKTETTGRNRWETRELTVFPAKAWFRDTPWEKLIKTVLRLERTVCKRAPATATLRANDRGRLLDFLGFKPNAAALERVDPRPLADRERQPLRARHRLRRGRFPHPQEPRHRRSPTILRLQSDPRRWRLEHPKRFAGAPPSISTSSSNCRASIEN